MKIWECILLVKNALKIIGVIGLHLLGKLIGTVNLVVKKEREGTVHENGKQKGIFKLAHLQILKLTHPRSKKIFFEAEDNGMV